MKPKNLLTQLSDLETSLNSFSFEELSSEEATSLQRSFMSFKSQLEEKVWGESPLSTTDTHPGGHEDTSPDSAARQELRSIAALSYHMRTPLNGIIGLTDLLKESQLSREQLYQVQTIHAAGRNLMNMVNELTEFSRLYAGLESFEKVDFNIHNLIEDVRYLCNTLIVDHQLELQIVMDQAIPRILKGDPSKLSQVLLHLLGDTLKQVRGGLIGLEVQFIHQEGEQVYLEFLIGNENREHKAGGGKRGISFKPSVAAAFQKSGHSGLGLPIVKQIVQKLGGELFVQETAGRATEFAFRIPFSISKSVPPGSKASKTVQLKDLKVLVFENNPLNQKTVERRLKSWGCIPMVTENVLYGMKLLNEEKIAMVLLDLKLPGMDALEIAARIRNHTKERVRRIPVIAVSTELSHAQKLACREQGISDCILKPYSAEELQSKLIRLLPGTPNPEQTPFVPSQGQAGSGQNVPRIDLQPVLADCLGKMETLEELVVLFKKKVLEFIGTVKLHLDREDFKGIAYSCQRISNSLKLLRTESLISLAAQMHKTSLTNPDLGQLRSLHRRFLEEYPLVEEALDKAMAQIKKQ